MSDKTYKSRWTKEDIKLLIEGYELYEDQGLKKMALCRELGKLFPDRNTKSIHYALGRYLNRTEVKEVNVDKGVCMDVKDDRNGESVNRNVNNDPKERVNKREFNPELFLEQLTYLLEREVSLKREVLSMNNNHLLVLQSENNRLKEKLAFIQKEYKELEELVTAWLNLGSINKAVSTNQFGQRLKVAVDNFGSVLNLSWD